MNTVQTDQIDAERLGAARRHRVLAGTPVGDLTLVGDGDALVAVWFDGHAHPPRPEALGEQVDAGADTVLDRAAAQLGEYFAGERTVFDLPLRAEGTDFQRRVWALLQRIPFGVTRSYGQLATELGAPGSSRAVGAANGRNPLSIVVPCHRVVGADGRLTGYAGGASNKKALLAFEAQRRTATTQDDALF